MVDPLFEKLPKEEAFEIWRVENFELVPWPKELYGRFHSGDSYLIYNAKGEKSLIRRDIYYWIGSESTQDEYTTLAIKAVQLDDYFKGFPVQHREVEGYESNEFIKLFNSVEYLQGGVPPGWNPKTAEITTQLFHIKGRKQPVAKQVQANGNSLNQGDAFILKTKTKTFLWIGKKANAFEKQKASAFADQFRGKTSIVRLENGETNEEFWKELGGETPIKDEEAGSDLSHEIQNILKIFKYENGKFSKVAEGSTANQKNLKGGIFIVQRGENVVVWINKGNPESKKGIEIGVKFLSENGLIHSSSMTVAKEEAGTSRELDLIFA